jgi:TM2 domain-containing membrane protein YozV
VLVREPPATSSPRWPASSSPGLGQLIQGRPGKALLHLILAGVLWLVTFGMGGWIMHIWSAIEAARWDD